MVTGVCLTEMLHHSAVDFPDGSACETQVYRIILSCYDAGEMFKTEISWCVPTCNKVAQ